jgi:hypothetical protein
MRTLRRAALFAASLMLFGAAAGAATETFEKAYSLEGVDRVRVENVNGRVDVTAWSRNYIRVTAVKSGSPSALENTLIRVTQPGSEIRIETHALRQENLLSCLFGFGRNRLAKVEYEILMPATTAARVETVNGSVHVDGRRSETHAETVNGSLDLRHIAGVLHAETVNGRISLERDGDGEDTSLESVNGSIDVEFPANASFRYRLSSINGRLEAADREARGHAFVGRRLEGEVNGGRTSLRAQTVNGSIRIVLAGGAPAPAPAPADTGASHEPDGSSD